MTKTDATPQPAVKPEVSAEIEDRTSESGTTGFPNDRRKRNIPVAKDRRASNAAEKRRTSERRRLIDPTTCERDYNDEETEFMKAMDRYKRENRRPFPTWSEVLEVLRSLGYRRVAEPTALPGGKKEGSGAVAAPAPGASAGPVPAPTPPPLAAAITPPPLDRRSKEIPVPPERRIPK
jgi:hypothetical protein